MPDINPPLEEDDDSDDYYDDYDDTLSCGCCSCCGCDCYDYEADYYVYSAAEDDYDDELDVPYGRN